MIWYNSKIRKEGKPIFDDTLYSRGLRKIKDIMNEQGTLLEYDEFEKKFSNKNFVLYYAIKSSI